MRTTSWLGVAHAMAGGIKHVTSHPFTLYTLGNGSVPHARWAALQLLVGLQLLLHKLVVGGDLLQPDPLQLLMDQLPLLH